MYRVAKAGANPLHLRSPYRFSLIPRTHGLLNVALTMLCRNTPAASSARITSASWYMATLFSSSNSLAAASTRRSNPSCFQSCRPDPAGCERHGTAIMSLGSG